MSTVTSSDIGFARALATVARALHTEESVQQTLQTMVDLAVSTVPGCEHAGVSIVSGSAITASALTPATITTPAASDDVGPAVDRIQYETDQGPCLDAIHEEDVFFTPDLRVEQRWPAFSTRAATETGVRSMLSFRLFVDNDTLGALNLYSRQSDAFGADSRTVGVVFAAHAALALSTAREHDRALDQDQKLDQALNLSLRQSREQTRQGELALALQRSMITDLPSPNHLQLAAVYRPAAAGHEVGGDFYDAFVLPDGATSLVIGDVVGHDVRAAATMGALRNVLRAITYDRAEPPAQIVHRVDAAVQGLGMDVMATLILARIEQTQTEREAGVRRLRWTNAGHPPPLLLHPDGRAELLRTPPDVFIGVDAELSRTDHEVVLEAGSTLLLFTDGLIERRGEHLSDSLDHLVSAVKEIAAAGGTLQELLSELLHRYLGEAVEDDRAAGDDRTAGDDTAVLGVRMHPEDRPRPPEAGP